MAKNTEQKKRNGEETVSDDEIWSAIRYLEPETKETGQTSRSRLR